MIGERVFLAGTSLHLSVQALALQESRRAHVKLVPPHGARILTVATPQQLHVFTRAPNAPFAARQGSASSSSSSRPPSVAGSVTSLAHNYLPAKFSSSLVTRRKPKGARSSGKGVPRIPGFARGGGVDAFGAGADRIPGERDEDEDDWGGRSRSLFAGVGRAGKRVRWTRFKVILFAANLVLISYALASLITLLLVYFRVFRVSAVLLTANSTELLLSTLASSFLCFVGLLGFPGILLNNRPFLAVYTFFLWIGFGLMVVPGYLAYKRRNLNLDGKINQQWSRELGAEDRLIIQGALQCCGYFSPFVEATLSATCYSRSVLPGCKSQFLAFERLALERFYTFSFGLVPVHIGVIVCALLCSNHVTYRFGKGMMPRAYRLKQEDVALIVDRYARHVSRRVLFPLLTVAQSTGGAIRGGGGFSNPGEIFVWRQQRPVVFIRHVGERFEH
ncbi:unnamed protein product [Mycena citricolor]|uniref:Tetraspanin Tsp2 n=1 Tax=Mycena citricolor TaxID=2018698 RepID=A0AAD2K060_9AGAR|nr:unnamed protein product [Mycena citricolor]